MSLYVFIIASFVYIMMIHFAIAIKNEFNVFLMIGYFIIGGVVGWQLQSYELGFTLSVVLSLLLW